MILPDKNANKANVAPIMAELPAARPSIPSVRFAPLETAVTINITTIIKAIQAYFCAFVSLKKNRSLA